MNLNSVQFDQERLDNAFAVPAEERRLALYTERQHAARRDATKWALQVDHSSHDDLKAGVTARQQTHVLLSREEYPDPLDAEREAYLWGHARGTYPTRVRHV